MLGPKQRHTMDVTEKQPTTGADYNYEKNLRTALPQLIAVSIKNLLLLVYGMTLGFITILIPAVKDPIPGEVLHLGQSEISWIGSINLITVPLGCALSGVVTSPLGRRRAMQIINAPILAAWLLLHYASSKVHLYIALGLCGLAGGLLEAPVLTYVAEVTLPHLRGFLASSSSMIIILGVFTQFLFGLIFYWRTVAVVDIFFTLMALGALFFLPESPHWLISRNRVDEATKSLQWLRGWTTSAAVQKELMDIKRNFTKKAEAQEVDKGTFLEQLSDYAKPSFLRPYLLVAFSFFVGHFSGMTSLQTYALEIFKRLRSPLDRYYATLVMGVMQLCGAGVCMASVHVLGKRRLAFASLLATALCCATVAGYDLYMHIIEESHNTTTPDGLNVLGTQNVSISTELEDHWHSWIPVAALMLLAGVSHVGIRLLPWVLIGEVFSARTRSGASGLSSATGYVFAFLSNKFFTSMLDTMYIRGTYGFYALIAVIGALVLYYTLPETEGKKLIDIENHFAGVKKLTNEVYRSKRRKQPTPSCDNTVELEAPHKDWQCRDNPAFQPDTQPEESKL